MGMENPETPDPGAEGLVAMAEAPVHVAHRDRAAHGGAVADRGEVSGPLI